MTDRELAQNLRDAEQRGDIDDTVYYLNEIIVRLDLPLNQTEQGLTPEADRAVDAFIRQHASPEMERINGLS